jgi:hypothetical protein
MYLNTSYTQKRSSVVVQRGTKEDIPYIPTEWVSVLHLETGERRTTPSEIHGTCNVVRRFSSPRCVTDLNSSSDGFRGADFRYAVVGVPF